MAHQHQIPAPSRLRLPDMHHLVNEQPLRGAVRAAEVLALKAAVRMEMQCTHRRNHHPARLEATPLMVAQANPVIVNSITEPQTRDTTLDGRQDQTGPTHPS